MSVGNQKFRLSELRSLVPGPSPSVQTAKGDTVKGPISGLGKKVEAKVGTKTETVDLNEAALRLGVTYLQPPPPVSKIDILVEARQGSKTLVRLRRQLRLDHGGACLWRRLRPRSGTSPGLFQLPAPLSRGETNGSGWGAISTSTA